MLAHQAAHKIQESTVIEEKDNNQETCWINKTKYL
jgi:hypothetical protein